MSSKIKLDPFGRPLPVASASEEQFLFSNVFRLRKRKSLESLDNYVQDRHSDILDDDGFQIVADRIDLIKNRLGVPDQIGFKKGQTSFSSHTTASHSISQKKQKYVNSKSQLYAGITHSDLDIQTSRPPLMHYMNIIEWVWLQTNLSHRSIMMIIMALLVIAFLNFTYGLELMFTPERVANPYLCKTKACRNLAKRLQTTINTSVDPCEDFYAFTCGSSDVTLMSPLQEKGWSHGFDSGRLAYSFRTSVSLGRMLKKTNKFPESLILTMYRGCLEERQRQSRGLEPFYSLLKQFKLYDIQKTSSLTTADLIESMALILAHSISSSSIIDVVYYLDQSGAQRSYLTASVSSPIQTSAVYRYGYRNYHDSILRAFKLLTELNFTQQEFDILPHDFVCLELFFRDQEISKSGPLLPIQEEIPLIGKECEVHTVWDVTTKGYPQANFGNTPNTAFDYALLIKRMYDIANPSQPLPPNWHLDPQNDANTNAPFIEAFGKEILISAPIRIMRYLQWRLFHSFALELSDEVLTTMIHVKRFTYLGRIPNCFHCLFSFLPFASSNRFVSQLSATGLGIDQVEREFHNITTRFIILYERMIQQDSYKQFLEVMQTSGPPFETFDETHVTILRAMLRSIYQVTDVSPLTFNDKNFPTYARLYENISLSENTHIENLLKMGYRMHQWRATPKFSSVFFTIDSKFHVPISLDRVQIQYHYSTHSFRLYLPLGIVEVPFFRDGLTVSDLSGLGITFAGVHQRVLFKSIANKILQDYVKADLKGRFAEFNLPSPAEMEAAVRDLFTGLIIYKDKLQSRVEEQLIGNWATGNVKWDKFSYVKALHGVSETVIIDQSRYHMMSIFVNEFLNKQTKNKDKRRVLPGFEKYNAKQVFYITLVSRRCEKFGPEKFRLLLKYGPLPQPLKNNIALSNLNDFSVTFECPTDSQMNSINKNYFWDSSL